MTAKKRYSPSPSLEISSVIEKRVQKNKSNCYYLFKYNEKLIIVLSSISSSSTSRKRHNIDINHNNDDNNNHNTATTIGANNFSSISSPYSNRRILVVDDEPDLSRLFRLGLQEAGFSVDVFNDPIAALDNYKTGFYDLLLLDIKMPRMDGFDLYQHIRNKDEKVKVCFISAVEEYYHKFKDLFSTMGQEKGCFIRKPIPLHELVKIIKSQLN